MYRIVFHSYQPLIHQRRRSARQMSHSLSLEVMEMAEAAALLDRLASGLEEFPRRSTVPSSSARERTEPPDRTCCWSLDRGHETGHYQHTSILCTLYLFKYLFFFNVFFLEKNTNGGTYLISLIFFKLGFFLFIYVSLI